MKNRIEKKLHSFSCFCAGAIVVLLLGFMCYLLPMAFFRTTGMSTGGGIGEIVSFEYDNFFLNLIALLMMLSLFYLLWRLINTVSMKTVSLLLVLWVILFGFALVVSARLQPSEDSYVLTFFAREAAKGDLSYYNEYFRFYPYQFGYVLYAELFFRLFFWVLPAAPEGFSSLALQGMNVLYTAFSFYALVRLSYLVFHSEFAARLTALLLFFCFPALFFVTYMYGNVPSFACVCASLWAFAVYRERPSITAGFPLVLFLCLAVILKLNSLIVLAAMLILTLLSFLQQPRLRSLLLPLVLGAAVFLTMSLPQRCYERRMGESFGGGIPMISWLAMGMNEGESCSGWYSPTYTTTAYKLSGYDREKTTEKAWDVIGKRAEQFAQTPAECRRFFGRKFLSQWNEPTYQSLWNNQLRGHYSEPGKLYELLCHEFARGMTAFMNLFQQFIFFGFVLGLLRILRRGELLMSSLPLIILGGMLYHLLFEAKSQHSQGYFLMMIPVAAYGLQWLFMQLKRNKAE